MKTLLVFGLISLPIFVQAKVFTPKDFAFDCHGTYVIASMSNARIETRTVPSRAPIAPTYDVAVADVTLQPKVVTAECGLIESKYKIPVPSLERAFNGRDVRRSRD